MTWMASQYDCEDSERPYWQLIDVSLLSDGVKDGCYRHETREKFWVWS